MGLRNGEAAPKPRVIQRILREIRGKVIAAVVYPCVLAIVATGVVIALMTFVVPKVVEQFDSMGQALPLLTRAIIGLSRAMTQWGWLAALLFSILKKT